MNLIFAYPKFLFLLILVPIFIILYFLSFYFRKKKALVFPNFEALERVFGIEIFSRNSLALILNMIILSLLILSLAGTQVNYTTNYPSFVFAIDNSGSMKTMDIIPSRLEAAKQSAKDFIDSLPIGAEVGVIEFSSTIKVIGKLGSPGITLDLAIDGIQLSEAQGTDIYGAISASNNLLKGRNNKVVILISDGQLNLGSLEQIISYAKKNNLQVNTIVIGTENGGLNGEIISTADENSLNRLAMDTGGQSFRIQDLDNLDRSIGVLSTKSNQSVLDISVYLLLAAIILFSLSWVLHNFRFKILPQV